MSSVQLQPCSASPPRADKQEAPPPVHTVQRVARQPPTYSTDVGTPTTVQLHIPCTLLGMLEGMVPGLGPSLSASIRFAYSCKTSYVAVGGVSCPGRAGLVVRPHETLSLELTPPALLLPDTAVLYAL